METRPWPWVWQRDSCGGIEATAQGDGGQGHQVAQDSDLNCPQCHSIGWSTGLPGAAAESERGRNPEKGWGGLVFHGPEGMGGEGRNQGA